MSVPFVQRSRADRPPLRVGLLLDEGQVPRYGLEVINQIRRSDFARLELIAVAAESTEEAHGGWLYEFYRRWDRRHIEEATNPIQRVDSSTELAGVPTIRLKLGRTRNGGSAEGALRPILDARLDVVIDLREGSRATELPAAAATFGVWSLRHTDRTQYRGGPECFWEVYEGNPLSGGELEARPAGEGAEVLTLSRCVVATNPGLSWARNRQAPFWAANAFVIQKLYELHAYGWEHVKRRAVAPAPYRGARPEYDAPTNWEMVRWLAPTVARKAVRRLTGTATQTEWRLAIRRSETSLLDRAPGDRVTGFRWLKAQPARWYADPFLVAHRGETWAFFEDADAATGLGRLSAAPIGSGDELGDPVPVLERAHHLSYPCVIADAGEWFMIPETSASNTVELLRCRKFPDDWTLEGVLLRAKAVDTTVWIEDGRYWLFTTLIEPRSFAMQLWLFTADRLTGPWTPHPENPISMDVRNARGAGAIFQHSGKLYRPSQDCSGRYGRTFSLNEILTLTPDRYAETPVATVEPMPGLVGTHTYARCGDVEMIDGCALLPKR